MFRENSQAWIDNRNFYNFSFYLDLKYFTSYICSYKSSIQKWTKYTLKCPHFHSGAWTPAATAKDPPHKVLPGLLAPGGATSAPRPLPRTTFHSQGFCDFPLQRDTWVV